MRVLLVKLTSLGDCIHALPALTDAKRALPNIQFDWVIDETLTQIAHWHNAVSNTPAVALRRWRKTPSSSIPKIFSSICSLRANHYDLVIDAHAMFKSALISLLAKGPIAGYTADTVVERGAHWLYTHRYFVNKKQHAVERIRHLFAKALHYTHPNTHPDYGIVHAFSPTQQPQPTIVVMANTTWPNKHWGEDQWRALFTLLKDSGHQIKLTSGNAAEWQRANRLAEGFADVEAMPKQDLQTLGNLLFGADAAITVDTGLGHLAAALSVPCVGIYGPTDPILARNNGHHQTTLSAQFDCAPCMKRSCGLLSSQDNPERPPCMRTITPEQVYAKLLNTLSPV